MDVNSLWKARKVLSGVSSSLVVAAYCICIAIAKSQNVYTGGLAMPYFSDIGRDRPGYYVFAALLTTASVLMMGFMVLQHYYFRAWFGQSDKGSSCCVVPALIVGLLTPICSILLSCFDTSSYPNIHNYSAIAFFALIVIWVILTTIIFCKLASQFDEHRRLLTIRYWTVGTLAVAFIVYIPVGIALMKWDWLTMAECTEELELGDDYCESHRYKDTNSTDLFNYAEAEGIGLMRSSTQFACMISIMVFLFINVGDPDPNDSQKATETAESTSVNKV